MDRYATDELTLAEKVVRSLQGNAVHADAAEFLTATPLEMGSNDLYVLLNLLRPDLVRDFHTFEVMTEPNPAINSAVALARAATLGWQERARIELERAARPRGVHSPQTISRITFAGGFRSVFSLRPLLASFRKIGSGRQPFIRNCGFFDVC